MNNVDVKEVKHLPLKRKTRIPRARQDGTARTKRAVRRPAPIVSSEHPRVSVVIPAMNERRTIAAVIANARKVHPETEVIVIVNGSTDGTETVARKMGAYVHAFGQALGHDVGRAIGARHARGDTILFTDGDIVIPALKLRAFADAVLRGADIALNRYNGRTRTPNAHSVVVAKHALNAALSRKDLAGSSMTTIPHAISRKALDTIGVENLAVPPLALTIAIWKGLSIQRTAYVEVGRSNPRRRQFSKEDPLKRLIVGDHVEALEWVLRHSDERGGFTDLVRRRERVR